MIGKNHSRKTEAHINLCDALRVSAGGSGKTEDNLKDESVIFQELKTLTHKLGKISADSPELTGQQTWVLESLGGHMWLCKWCDEPEWCNMPHDCGLPERYK